MEVENRRGEENIEMTFTPAEEESMADNIDELTEDTEEVEESVSGVESTERSIEQLKKFTEEDEDLESATKTLFSILGGDFLTKRLVRNQLPLVVLIAGFFCIHISFRDTNQKELVEISKLKRQVEDARFNALTRVSELTAKSRQSYVEEFLIQHNDSTLQTSTQPPYIIYLSGDDGNFASPDKNVIDAGREKTPLEVGTTEEVIE